jgi:hypothetical protein
MLLDLGLTPSLPVLTIQVPAAESSLPTFEAGPTQKTSSPFSTFPQLFFPRKFPLKTPQMGPTIM